MVYKHSNNKNVYMHTAPWKHSVNVQNNKHKEKSPMEYLCRKKNA